MISNERLQWLSKLDGYLLSTIEHLTLELPDVFNELILLRAQRDELLAAMRKIEDHHGEDDSWRDIARTAISHCKPK